MHLRPIAFLVGVMILAACADRGSHVPSAVPGAALLTHRGSENGAYPAALGQGRLVIRDGCVAMRPGGGGATTFILWAPGFGLREHDGRTEVIDPEGNLVAAIGDPITLGGGYFDLGAADQVVDTPIPASCRDEGAEPYFLASPDAWPFAEAGGVRLLRHDGAELSGDEALIEGTISIVGGCIGLDADGPWLVWPIDFGLGQDDGPLEIWDGRQRAVATVGDTVRLGGGIGSIPDPVSMPGGVPDDCRGEGESYWYVGDIEVVG